MRSFLKLKTKEKWLPTQPSLADIKSKSKPKPTPRRANRELGLKAILGKGIQITDEFECSEIVEQILQFAVVETGADCGYVMLWDAGTEVLRSEIAFSSGAPIAIPETYDGPGTPEWQAFRDGIFVNTLANAQSAGRKKSASSEQLESSPGWYFPLISRGNGQDRQEGVLAIVKPNVQKSDAARTIDCVQVLSGAITTALSNSRTFNFQRDQHIRSLVALVDNMEAKDITSAGHSQRVAHLCERIANQLSLDSEIVSDLRTGALLHEVGMVGIPESIVLKPGILSPSEFEQLKLHTQIGYEMCKPLGLSEDVLMLIRNHHERLDGTGYPDRLKNGELPLPLRIICVADAFDAMSSFRHHRAFLDTEERKAQMNRFAGTQFDPIVVEALKDLVNNDLIDDLYANMLDAVSSLDAAFAPEAIAA